MTDSAAQGIVLESFQGVLLRSMQRVAVIGFPEGEVQSGPIHHTLRLQAFNDAALEPYDGVLLNAASLSSVEALTEVTRAVDALHDDGALYLALDSAEWTGRDLLLLCEEAGLLPYAAWTPGAEGRLEYVPLPIGAECSAPGLCMAVRQDYDPVRHAERLHLDGHPGWALEILENVPATLLTSDEARGLVLARKLPSLLAWDSALGEEGRLNRFARLQDDFYKATTYLPFDSLSYQCRAISWQRIGRPDMARRQLQSLIHVTGDAASRALLEKITATAAPEGGVVPPEWGGAWPRRLLYVVHPETDYGPDVLFDGLCAVLGDGNVVDFPWKPSLHGAPASGHAHYPCVFGRGGERWDLARVVAGLREGHFDAVVYADTLCMLDQETARAVMAAVGDIPVFLLDPWDQCGNYAAEIGAYCGAPGFRAQFKREVLAGVDYGPDVIPLPFAYAKGRIPERVSYEGREGLFWVGQMPYGARRLTLEWLREWMGLRLDLKFSQVAYVQELARACVGLCLFGNGYDTVRYWELSAHGCLLLAERVPIVVPYDFRDGKEAVLFDHIADLEEKAAYYLAHPQDALEIAEAGHERLKRYHTNEARARQMLGWMEAYE